MSIETAINSVNTVRYPNVLGTLPIPQSSLVGREREVRDAIDRVASHRIVTVVGEGGIGKTRLVIEVTRRLAQAGRRVGFVELAEVEDPCDVLDAIADQLSIEVAPGESRSDGLVHWLAYTPTVLVIDNFEHVLDAAPDIDGVVDQCSSLNLVVTSRRALGTRDESTLLLSPLAQHAASTNEYSPGVELFLERAAIIEPSVADVGAATLVVANVGGIPLAIELAAFRARTLGATVALDLLVADLSLDGLARSPDGPARHRSLRQCVEWSYRALDEDTQSVFRATGAFSGTFDATALVAVAGDLPSARIGLATLADHHLVETVGSDRHPASRFTNSPPIREYARDLLSARPENDLVVDLHARWYASIAAELRYSLERQSAEPAFAGFLRDESNIVGAMRSCTRRGNLGTAAQVACSVAKIGIELGREPRVMEWFRNLAAAARETGQALPFEAQIFVDYAVLADRRAGSATMPLAALRDTIARARAAGDDVAVLQGLERLVRSFIVHGDPPLAFAAAAEGIALAARLDLPRREAEFSLWTGMLMHVVNDLDAACAHGFHALRLARELGDSRLIVRCGLLFAPMTLPAQWAGEAVPALDACLDLARASESVLDEMYVVMQLAVRAGFDAQPDAGVLVEQGFELAERTRSHPAELVSMLALAASAFQANDDAIGARIHAALRAEWPMMSALLPAEALDRYVSIVESRRAIDPARFGASMDTAAASLWPDVLDAAKRYAATRVQSGPGRALTPRERDVLRELVGGGTNKDIAHALGIRPKTVMHHCAAIYRKLGVKSRSEATAVALRAGLFDDESLGMTGRGTPVK